MLADYVLADDPGIRRVNQDSKGVDYNLDVNEAESETDKQAALVDQPNNFNGKFLCYPSCIFCIILEDKFYDPLKTILAPLNGFWHQESVSFCLAQWFYKHFSSG